MPQPQPLETATRIGCGAFIGLLVGLVVVVGLVGSIGDSRVAMAAFVALSVLVCAFLGWRLGDRFFQSLHRWLPWLG
jgi:hypothetical protein